MRRLPSTAIARTSLQLSRSVVASRASLARAVASPASRRWASSSAPRIRYGFRGSLLRWAIAIGGVYWYTTQGSKVFAEEPAYAVPQFPPAEREDENLPTVDEVHAARKARRPSQSSSPPSPSVSAGTEATGGLAGGVSGLEEEADEQGAFDPETGEINWDCPCLGGMAHGPCGPEFREAFSCFVYSKEEPKGMDCVDRFRGMQECFRKHPEIYGDELEGENDDEEAEAGATAGASTASASKGASGAETGKHATSCDAERGSGDTAKSKSTPANIDHHELAVSKLKSHGDHIEGEELVPRQWHDTRDDNKGK